ncbi:hypothetical protein [Nocardia sp. NPDC057455]
MTSRTSDRLVDRSSACSGERRRTGYADRTVMAGIEAVELSADTGEM